MFLTPSPVALVVEINERGAVCSTHWIGINAYTFLVGTSEGKRSLGKSSNRWADKNQIDLKNNRKLRYEVGSSASGQGRVVSSSEYVTKFWSHEMNTYLLANY